MQKVFGNNYRQDKNAGLGGMLCAGRTSGYIQTDELSHPVIFFQVSCTQPAYNQDMSCI